MCSGNFPIADLSRPKTNHENTKVRKHERKIVKNPSRTRSLVFPSLSIFLYFVFS
jgi:hypothetical protein